MFYDCHIPQVVTWGLLRQEDCEKYRPTIFSRLKEHGIVLGGGTCIFAA